MKYGLIVYFDTDNIGDDILSYSASRFLPSVDYVIDREHMDTFLPSSNEYVKAIINGWYLKNKFNWPPSEFISPLFIGIHFSDVPYWGIKDEFLDSIGTEYLKKFGPIGCRDKHTVGKLKQRGVEAYFSGCVTLTLQRFENVDSTDNIILVDVPETVEKVVTEKCENVEIVTHSIKSIQDGYHGRLSWNERLQRVEELLKKYQGAKLVITTRLHCALPCLALGTNVIMVKQNNIDYQNRIGAYECMLTCITEEELSNISFDALEIKKSTIVQELGNSIRKKIQDFLLEDLVDARGVPNISEYERLYNKKLIWQKKLLKQNEKINVDELFAAIDWQKRQLANNAEYISSIETENKKLKDWISKLEDEKLYLESENKRYKEDIEEWHSSYKELEQGKDWVENKLREKTQELQDLKEGYDKLQEGKEWLEIKWKEQIKELQELKEWCDELQESKNWLESEYNRLTENKKGE